MTDDLIEQTRRVWQPYYKQVLTFDDAVKILRVVGQLVDVVVDRREPAREGWTP